MSATAPAESQSRRSLARYYQELDDAGIACEIALDGGQLFRGPLFPARHRACHITLLHRHTRGLVELAHGPRQDGRLAIHTRGESEDFLPGGGDDAAGWEAALLSRATALHHRGEEVFISPVARQEPRGGKEAVTHAGCVWVDIDEPDGLDRLWAFCEERPCHLLVASGGGGVHAYWLLDAPLPCDERDALERANRRLAAAVGGDPQCVNRSRILRLAGTVNHKRQRWAHIVRADFAMGRWPAATLVGDLPDPTPARATNGAGGTGNAGAATNDPYREIPAADYLAAIFGTEPGRGGLVTCPNPGHQDKHPSCSLTGPLFHCHACGVGGGIYDAAALYLGLGIGGELRGEAFLAARAVIEELFGGHP